MTLEDAKDLIAQWSTGTFQPEEARSTAGSSPSALNAYQSQRLERLLQRRKNTSPRLASATLPPV